MNLHHIVKKSFFISLLGLILNQPISAGIDLELSQTTSNPNPAQYSNFSMTLTVTNNGNETATNVVVELPINNIDDIVYSGGNEFSASQGVFYPYGTEIWEVGNIPAGQSVTITTNYFVLDTNPYTVYAQVLNADQSDTDSSPNNGTPPTPNEDDESALNFNASSCAVTVLVSNIVCDDNGTPNNSQDDLFSFDFTPENPDFPNGTWSASLPNPVSGPANPSGNYGETVSLTYLIADFPNGTILGTISHSDPTACSSIPLLVAVPAPCSNGGGECQISASTSNPQCFDGGTPNDMSDDTWSFDLFVAGSNTGSFWTTSINGQSFSGNYNETVILGLFPIISGGFTFTITDSNDTSCTDNISINPPAPCSNGGGCQISGQIVSIDCSNNGTPNNLNDDTWGFVLFIAGTNASNNWFFEFGNATYSGAYNQELTFTNFPLTGPETLVLDVKDQVQQNCTSQIILEAPFPCEVTGDLADIELTMNSNSTAGAFEFVSFDVTVTNSGAADATGVFISVPLPDNTVLQGGNSYSATGGLVSGFNTVFWSFPTLAVNQTETLTVNYFTLSEDAITCYAQVVDMIGDDFDSTPNNGTPPIPNEDDEAAFTLGSVPLLPDLTVSNLIENFPSVFEIGVDYPFTFDLINIGNTLAAGDFRIGAYLSLDQNFDGNDILVGEVVTGNIANTITINGLINVENSTPSQDYFFILVADDLNDISESNENNNELSSNEMFTVFNLNDNCTGTFTANTQAELDAFNQNCTTWAGSIKVTGTAHDLTPLSNLDIILGNLIIEDADVSDLSPLSGLQEAGTLFFYFNDNLTNFNGLPSSIITQSVQIIGNINLINLDGFPSVPNSVDNFTIANNADLQNIQGAAAFSGNFPEMVLVVSTNPSLTSLNGLENITEVSSISVDNNNVLSECCAVLDLLNNNAYNSANFNSNENGCNSIQDVINSCTSSLCELTATVLDIQCQFNQSINNAFDDTFTARLLVDGNSFCMGNFFINGELPNTLDGAALFGNIITMGPYQISDGDVTLEITDSNGGGGVTVVLEAPPSCSNGPIADECGFEQTYPGVFSGTSGFGVREVTETGTGYDLTISTLFSGDPAFTHIDLGLDFAGNKISENSTLLPTDIFEPSADGNFYKAEAAPNNALTLSKVEADGTEIWSNTVSYDSGGPQSSPILSDAFDVADGTVFLVRAFAPQDLGWITKLDLNGNLVFNNSIPLAIGGLDMVIFDLALNGDFLISRRTGGSSQNLMRISSTGSFIFDEPIIGDLVTSRFGGFAETPDGNFVYASYRDQTRPALEKVNAFTGERIWKLELNNVFSPGSVPYFVSEGKVVATSDGGAVVGYPFSPLFGNDPAGYEYGRVNADGNVVWWHHLPDTYDFDAHLETSDGGFLFVGKISQDLATFKTTSQGFLDPTCEGGSGTCMINASATNIFCDDNGTPNNPLDDLFGFELLVSGSNTGSGFLATDNSTGQTIGGLYDVLTPFPDLFNIPNNASLLITDNQDSNCSTLLTINAPPACSDGGNTCQIAAQVQDITCNDWNTPNDPTDDVFNFFLFVSGSNLGSGFTSVQNTNNFTINGQYNNLISYPASVQIQGGPITLAITDNDDSNCTTSVTVTPPAPCSNGGGGNGVDLELDLSTSSVVVSAFDFITVTATILNNGDAPASGIVVDYPLPAGVTYQGGNEYNASQGTYAPYGNQEWNVGSLAAGESATLAINYFVLGGANPLEFYTQVIAQNEADADSSPNNGTPPTTNEDDEAILMIAKSGQNLIGNNTGINQNANFETLDFQIVKLFPNPVADNLNLEIGTATDGIAQIKLMNLQGQILQFSEKELVQGLNKIKMNVSDLPRGIHFIFIKKEDRQEVVRFVRQ